jgi:hypothetical protein
VKGLFILRKAIPSDSHRRIYLIEERISSLSLSSSSQNQRRLLVRNLFESNETIANDLIEVPINEIDDLPMTNIEFMVFVHNMIEKYKALFTEFYITVKLHNANYIKDYLRKLSKK